eukprot:CAMPEP_0204902026 /NCGR_PEP_ID=MMETSP1397-20131031/3423_1 /ASSEMBLY_ACC=CAM_ASM_000891 /TAXON_ID=49980 /ORGANISM="Climacostomum Climacostomum virens, Strain Stock W-24" /LENGTH=300 /DNA_ID=CAMNT_0052070467 /DNA_START=30 /DNA_END=932 /DNA_ORIENTATION=-
MKKKQQEVQQMRMEAKLEELKAYMKTERRKRTVEEIKAQPIKSNSIRVARAVPTHEVSQTDLSALTNTETGLTQVKQFLTSCGLERYYDELTNNGIDDMEILLELSDSHLNGLNIPLGHRIKLLKRIKEVREEETQRQPTPPRAKKSMSIEITEKPFEVSSDLFKQAMDHFRKGGSASQRVAIVEGLVNSTSDQRIGRQSVRTRTSATSTMTATMLVENKTSCWQCYSLHIRAEGLKFDGKDFCSQVCCDMFTAAQQQDCKCGKKFIRANGVLRLGARYCSQECANKVQEDGPVDAFSGW